MKYTFKQLTLGLALGAMTLSSCAGDWLETSPTGSASKDEILLNTDNAKQAINGLCKLMIMQHGAYGQGFNGEGTIMLMYGEYTGQDFQFPIMAPGWAPLMNGMSMILHNKNSIYPTYPWYYYYSLVGNANTLLEKIDEAQGSSEAVKFIKAEALTFRAYAYSMLIQIYADRWADSNNGSGDGVVLRLDTSMGDIPMSTQGDVYKQIYKDLDDAIALYKESGLKRSDLYEGSKSAICYPDINVAYAIYAKSALTREDYTNAVKYAQLAREGFNLMSNADYKAGFMDPTSEWIWGAFNNASETLYYWSFQTTMAYNGYFAGAYGGTTASRNLIDAVPSTDIRKSLFVHKDVFSTPEQDLNSLVNTNGYGDFISEEAFVKANQYAQENCTLKPAEILFPYTNLKFACTAQPGVGCIPFLRSSEMYLIEAEANYFLNKEAEAQKCLVNLNTNTNRDPEYTCNATGEDLLDEIIFYRRLELWGEGRSWFDCKRLKRNVVRKGFNDGGNFHAAIAGEFGNDPLFWSWIIPAKETDYNSGLKLPE